MEDEGDEGVREEGVERGWIDVPLHEIIDNKRGMRRVCQS
jgi:hypothetical protein